MKREKWKKVIAMLACSAVLSQGMTPNVYATDYNTQLKDLDESLSEEPEVPEKEDGSLNGEPEAPNRASKLV